MKPAPCSWRVRISLICFERESESRKSRFSSPGTPKMYSQPSASRHSMNRSDAFCLSPPRLLASLMSFSPGRGGSVAAGEVHLRLERLAGAEPRAITQEPIRRARLAGGGRYAREVHGDMRIVEGPQRMAGREGLGIGQVEDRAGNALVAQRLDERVLVDAVGTREVDQHGFRLHRRQFRPTDHAARLGRAG